MRSSLSLLFQYYDKISLSWKKREVGEKPLLRFARWKREHGRNLVNFKRRETLDFCTRWTNCFLFSFFFCFPFVSRLPRVSPVSIDAFTTTTITRETSPFVWLFEKNQVRFGRIRFLSGFIAILVN